MDDKSKLIQTKWIVDILTFHHMRTNSVK